MTDIAATDDLFFTRAGLDRARTEAIVEGALAGADDGEVIIRITHARNLATKRPEANKEFFKGVVNSL